MTGPAGGEWKQLLGGAPRYCQVHQGMFTASKTQPGWGYFAGTTMHAACCGPCAAKAAS